MAEPEPTANGVGLGPGPKVVEAIGKAKALALAQQEGARAAKWSVPARETIVEREIREQRERESALASQRQAALRHQILHDHNDRRRENNDNNSMLNNKAMSKSMVLLPTRDAHIILDLHKSGHEDSKFVKDTNNILNDSEEVKSPDSISYSFRNEQENSEESLSNDFSFQCSTKDTLQSDSSQKIDTSHSEMHDLDLSISVQTVDSSSNSSHEFHSIRNIVVKPFSEPDDDDDASSYIRWQKETPIEREIRLAREREEELRREKGLPPLPANNVVSTVRKSEVQKFTNRKNTAVNDCRSVQHRIATSRIQQEINKATEREKELHAAGLIQTISEDTVDSKVTRFTDLAGYAIEETERKLRRAVSTSSVAGETENHSVAGHSTSNGQKLASFRPLLESTPTHSNRNTISSKKSLPRVGHKGVMQRFLASRGKVSPVSSYSRSSPFSHVSYSSAVSPVLSSKDIGEKFEGTEKQVFDDTLRRNARRGYMSAEERIQTELQEMQKREEELRLQRAKLFAQSQPNLLSIGDFEDDLNHESEEMKRSSISGNSESGSLLENSKEANGGTSFSELSQWNSRKKNLLIAQWENRIQQSLQSEWES